jgi:hypothetical protein
MEVYGHTQRLQQAELVLMQLEQSVVAWIIL